MARHRAEARAREARRDPARQRSRRLERRPGAARAGGAAASRRRTSPCGSCRSSPRRATRRLFAALFGDKAFVDPSVFTHTAKRHAASVAAPQPWLLLLARRAPRRPARRQRALQRPAHRTGRGGMKSTSRRHRSALVALLLAGVALVLALLAVDVRAWQTTVRARRPPLPRAARAQGPLAAADGPPRRPGVAPHRHRRRDGVPARAAVLLVRAGSAATPRCARTRRRCARRRRSRSRG